MIQKRFKFRRGSGTSLWGRIQIESVKHVSEVKDTDRPEGFRICWKHITTPNKVYVFIYLFTPPIFTEDVSIQLISSPLQELLTGGDSWRQTSGFLRTFAVLPLGLVLVKVSLGVQLDPSCIHPGPAEAAIKYELLCCSKHISQGQSQAASYIALHQSPSKEAPEQTHPMASFRQHQRRMQLASQAAHPKENLSRHKTLLR